MTNLARPICFPGETVTPDLVGDNLTSDEVSIFDAESVEIIIAQRAVLEDDLRLRLGTTALLM